MKGVFFFYNNCIQVILETDTNQSQTIVSKNRKIVLHMHVEIATKICIQKMCDFFIIKKLSSLKTR